MLSSRPLPCVFHFSFLPVATWSAQYFHSLLPQYSPYYVFAIILRVYLTFRNVKRCPLCCMYIYFTGFNYNPLPLVSPHMHIGVDLGGSASNCPEVGGRASCGWRFHSGCCACVRRLLEDQVDSCFAYCCRDWTLRFDLFEGWVETIVSLLGWFVTSL